MKLSAFKNALNAFRYRRPFVPYLIKLFSGETISISHPEAIRPRGECFFIIEPSGRRRVIDEVSVMEVLEIPPPVPPLPATQPGGPGS